MSAALPAFHFDNTYARELPGLYAACQPTAVPSPGLLFFNRLLAEELGLDATLLNTQQGAALFAGNVMPDGAQPLAQVYAGHQFGHFSARLGDGRALLLGEVIDCAGRRRDIAFKGSGPTPYSRGGDGKAAVGPMLREVLMGEAMHALGIPTTRALAVAATGEDVFREVVLPGAVLTRVAASHLRVGSFEYFAQRRETTPLRQLAEYAIARHDPDLAGTPDRFMGFLRRVAERQAALVAQWMNVGFIHGVMNTDNVAVSGETIDYGPCAFMEAYDPAAVFSSIDHSGRYAYSNQPLIMRWNLARLAESLLPLVLATQADEAPTEAAIKEDIARATEVIDAFPEMFNAALLRVQRAKLGLRRATPGDDAPDTALAESWLALLQRHGVDFTLAWRRLADAAEDREAPLRTLFDDTAGLDAWLGAWRQRCASEDEADAPAAAAAARAARMRQASPWVIPRNHLVEEALKAATRGDLVPFENMLAALRAPFDEVAGHARYAEPAPAAVTACYQTFCGT